MFATPNPAINHLGYKRKHKLFLTCHLVYEFGPVGRTLIVLLHSNLVLRRWIFWVVNTERESQFVQKLPSQNPPKRLPFFGVLFL